jgi:hypothetical protein
MKSISWIIFTSIILLTCTNVFAAKEYTYVDTINMVTDLERIAVLPENGEITRQWSSYDRDSKYDEKTGKYIAWEANGDGYGKKNWIRKEGNRFVLGVMTGPGCIWRFWTATAFKGKITIYLDGQETPVVDLPCDKFFNCTQEPFNRPQLVHVVGRGNNNYTPISFQKSCKIVADQNYGQYYQFTYSLFPKGTKVQTFKMQLSPEESTALDKINQQLSNAGPNFISAVENEKINEMDIKIAPGEKKTISEITGPAAITSFTIKNVFPKDIEQQRLLVRELAIQITWDDQKDPAVSTPLGDFFGTAPGLNKHSSIGNGITDEYLYSNWFMPFEKSAKIEIINDSKNEITLPIQIKHRPIDPAKNYGRFHAKWHRDMFLPTEPERWIDWTILKTQGCGRFVGVALEIWNPRGGWWGEGDEKFFVDGEKFPSTFGTGSEDYFGYAWCDPTIFHHPYHNQPISEEHKGHASNNRWHISDNIPFQKSFEGCIEKYFANDRPTQYSCVAYWYLSPDGSDMYKPAAASERIGWYTELKYPLDVDGMLVLERPNGRLEAQHMGSFTPTKWTNDQQLWWTGAPGEKLRIGVSVKNEGEYKILTRLTKAVDYAIIQWYLNGQKISEPIDTYNKDGVIATNEIDLGKHHLNAGQNELSVEVVGANPDAVTYYMVGIDYIKVKK